MVSVENPSLTKRVFRDLQISGKELLATAIAYKIVAFIVLAPLVGFLFRILLAFSGAAVLSDVDILFFLLRPAGWLCFILIGALWLMILGVEQVSLVGIIQARERGQQVGVLWALRFAGAHAWPAIQVTLRLAAIALLVIAPFAAVAGLTYFALLSEFDINYYLSEKPPVFLVALGVGAILLLVLAGVLLRLVATWFFAIPLVLFEQITASQVLRESRDRTLGSRGAIVIAILVWGLATTIVSSIATGLVGLLARSLIPESSNSLVVIQLAVGVTLLCMTLVNLAVNVLGTTTLASLLFNLYRQYGGSPDKDLQVAIDSRSVSKTSFLFTRKRMLAAGIVGVFLSAIIGVATLQSVQLEDHAEVMAHRGSSKAAPENTMAAIRKAIEEGADWVEIDVQETADGEVVVLHDSDFMKLAGVNLKIWDATLEDLQNIDIGSRFDPEFASERVPTLAQVLDECRGKIGVNIELKYYGHDEQLERRVAEIVESCEMVPHVMLMSLKMDAVRKMKALRPNWKVGLLMSVAAGGLKKIEADFLAVNASFASPGFVRAAHKAGKEVYVWTVNDAATMSAMIGRGVDGLLTDKPALAREVLAQRADMSGPERLLLEVGVLLRDGPEVNEQ